MAFASNVGDRARDIRGWDAVSQRTVSLADYSGKWVLVEFWATWCGPCMKELPNLVAQTRDLLGRRDFAVLTVNMDSVADISKVHQALRANQITFPVVFDGHGRRQGNVQAAEWDVHSVPQTFLIDPQGTIVANMLRGKRLRPGLEFFLNHPSGYPPVGVRDSCTRTSAGLTLRLELYNPRHTPVRVKMDYFYERFIWAADDPQHLRQPVDAEYCEPDIVETEIQFGELGEASYEINLPLVKDTYQFDYNLHVLLPGTEHVLDGKGLWVSKSGNLRFDDNIPDLHWS